MNELITNIHIHSTYSDGSGTYQSIANAGLDAGIDVIILTDHNVLVKNAESYYRKGSQRLLFLIGEEIHDRNRQPQKNHLLVISHGAELSSFAYDPQLLINKAKLAGGLTFIAHPFEHELKIIGEPDISWVDWSVTGFHGMEIWNHLSELKSVSPNWLKLLFHVFFPQFYPHQPNPYTIQKWDSITRPNRKIVGIGGSDSHALKMKKGGISRIIFPYKFDFQCVNTHILVPNELCGNINEDKQMVLNAFNKGNVFIGYDYPAPTKGFRFSAQGSHSIAQMGDEIELESSVTFQIRIPQRVECRLICNGKTIKQWVNQEICTFVANEPGVYRVECYIQYLGKKRGWIFSNPINVEKPIGSK